MKGSQRVIDQLAKLLKGELAARDQYLAHAKKYEDLGFTKLFEHSKHESEHESEHAEAIIARMLFLEAEPDLSQLDALNVGDDVPSMLQNDLDLEYSVVGALREAMKVCEEEQDYVSRDMLLKQLDDTEMDHAHWLEQQLGLIKLVGLPNYLQSQI